MRTNDIAKALGVHSNTVRLYENEGFLPPIPRAANGYRQYSTFHLEQARLVRLALQWPYLGDKASLIRLVKNAAQGDLGMAMELAYKHLVYIRVERTYAEAAIEFLERWAAGHLIDVPRQQMRIQAAASHLNVSLDMLRNWERSGLLNVPRDPVNHYRLYGPAEFGRLRVIRMLVQAGYSLMAVLQMLNQFDAGTTDDLRLALHVSPADEKKIEVIADHWLTNLVELEQRAQAIIKQISRMIELSCNTPNHPNK